MEKKINIIGAGLAGLSAGIYLQQRGFRQKFSSLQAGQGACVQHG